ncbi:MAG: hypothetical protein SFZ02_06610 [bacterium]|nr:hypothetical protein [bacterium]
MQSDYTGHITTSEWRWVIIISVVLALLAFMPFLWVLMVGISDSQWRFMGALHDYQNSAIYLSMMEQGAEGKLLMHYLHTPEIHNGAFVEPLYALLGQAASIIRLSPIVMFHVARVGASVFMYLAIYQLASHIWTRVRTRRIFFTFVVVASGLGWILIPLTQSFAYIDLQSPYIYPFFSSLTNVHLPLAIASVALLASLIIVILRPSETVSPTITNGGGLIFGLALLLVVLYPFAYVPIVTAFVINLVIYWADERKITRPHLEWLLMLVIPALPVLLYNALVFQNNVVIQEIWRQQNTTAPSPILLLLAVALPFVIALPGLRRVLRRFNRDGDQFMFIWLLAMLAWVYLPVAGQEHFLLGFMLPLGYFATRSIADFWFGFIKRMWQMRVFAAMLPIIGMSHLFVLLTPLYPIAIDRDVNNDAGILLERDYVRAFVWLSRMNSDNRSVILASPNTSLWLPLWTGGAVVYGHPTITTQASFKRQAVIKWYQETEISQCDNRLLRGEYSFRSNQYAVRYVVFGPQEARLGAGACIGLLRPVAYFDSVSIYIYNETP